MKFAFHTLGCKVNMYETQALMQLAEQRGHEVVASNADAVIINTCTVTSTSEHKNIRAIHKLKRENPHAVIAACGCFAEVSPEKVCATGEIDIVCGTKNRAGVLEQCEAAVFGASVRVDRTTGCEGNAFELLPAGIPRGRTRALLKIQDGCNLFCSYCIIPYARGRVRSMPYEAVQQEIKRLAQGGVREIVLTGIEISAYGQDLIPRMRLIDLLEKILKAFPQIRFRLGSLEPRTVDREFCIRLAGRANLARHFHLSLQSGSLGVLRRMRRAYTPERFLESVNCLKDTFPDCSITTDIIAGFPGETDAEFEETLAFIERCAFAAVHVFPFSIREGTRAAAMPNQISNAIKKERVEAIRQVATRCSRDYRTQFLQTQLMVLAEHQDKNGRWSAHSTYAFPVYVDAAALEKNQEAEVRVIALQGDGVLARMICTASEIE